METRRAVSMRGGSSSGNLLRTKIPMETRIPNHFWVYLAQWKPSLHPDSDGDLRSIIRILASDAWKPSRGGTLLEAEIAIGTGHPRRRVGPGLWKPCRSRDHLCNTGTCGGRPGSAMVETLSEPRSSVQPPPLCYGLTRSACGNLFGAEIISATQTGTPAGGLGGVEPFSEPRSSVQQLGPDLAREIATWNPCRSRDHQCNSGSFAGG